jgi:hypothetical protein
MSNRSAQFLLFILIGLSPAQSNSGINGEKRSRHIQAVDPIVLNGVSVPSDYPFVKITVNENPDTGYIFLNTSWWGSEPNYNMILDNSGAPVWYHRTQDMQQIRQDLKVQPDGRITQDIEGGDIDRLFIAMDSTYTVVDTFKAPPGYRTDEHDLIILPNNHYLIIAEKDTLIDMSQIVPGGHPQAVITNYYLAEMDENDYPVFFWNSMDYLDLQDAVHIDLTQKYIDYVHMNSVDVDHDGNFIISSRHLSEIIKISRHTGDIIWRLGGEHDYFTWVNDEYRISYQHDARVLPNGNYTVFDNGNYHDPQFSRALELSVDTTNWTVTKVWEYRNTPDYFSWAMGNVQRLPNGNTLINWAWFGLPKVMEVRPDGSKAFEMDFVDEHDSYRTFRFPWSGNAAVPYLIIEPHEDYITLLFNKFGDVDVSEYRIYSGPSPHPTTQIATATKPFVHLSTELENKADNYFRVTAVNSQGQESDFSNEESAYVDIDIIPAGENIVQNGDFSEGIDHWIWSTGESASAAWSIDEGIFHFDISHSDEDIGNIQLTQMGVKVINEKNYSFEFDAWADAGRAIEANVTSYDQRINYSEIGALFITVRKQHFAYTFHMEQITDYAMIQINAGGSDIDFYIDNISLKEDVESGVNARPQIVSIHDFSIKNNETFTINLDTCVVDSDNNSESMVWEIKADEADLEVTNANREAIFTVLHDWTGQSDVSFKVTDPQGAIDSLGIIVTVNHSTDVKSFDNSIPEEFILLPNYPNPFNPSTTIRYALPKSSEVTLTIYDLLGREITTLVNKTQTPGEYAVLWNGQGHPSGIYICHLRAGDFTETRKLVLQK